MLCETELSKTIYTVGERAGNEQTPRVIKPRIEITVKPKAGLAALADRTRSQCPPAQSAPGSERAGMQKWTIAFVCSGRFGDGG
jgi:hypothetical protein